MLLEGRRERRRATVRRAGAAADAVNRYLIDLQVPPRGTRCPAMTP